MCLRQINLDEFKERTSKKFGSSLMEHKAWIKKDPSFFEKKLGSAFIESHDDLDFFKIAFFTTDDEQLFTLLHYKNQPVQSATTVEMHHTASEDEIKSVLRKIKEFYNLTDDDFPKE